MDCLELIKSNAKKCMKKIALPESNDIRVLKAAETTLKEQVAIPVLIGNKDDIIKLAKGENIDLSNIEIVDPLKCDKYNDYVEMLYNLRKDKGMTLAQANDLLKDYVYFATCMLKAGDVDGVVSGAIHSTADTIRPALQIIKAKDISKKVSSFFVMNIPNSKYNTEYVFADCGLNIDPSAEELADIAMDSAASYKKLIGKVPYVALLSYSTLGSAKSESVLKVQEAKRILSEKNVDFEFDGELQLDAALDENVAKIKAPNSKVSGKANVLIFPNIDAGNIGYKLVERFGMADAIGPILQGLDKPVNDLSRGCKAQDIVNAIAITAIQAQSM